ncbi:MAG: hypothetical protein ABIF89_01930 [bacterium]
MNHPVPFDSHNAAAVQKQLLQLFSEFTWTACHISDFKNVVVGRFAENQLLGCRAAQC